MTNQKRFSVIMAVRNGENFIKKALQSLIENLEVNDELIVVDDNSTDNTVDKIKKFFI
jgi:glycosyltransferase involved in cell wall biosynthesis